MHKEIGGYLELERFSGLMLHEHALHLESGRACLSYLIEQRGIRKLLLPDFVCDVVEDACQAHDVMVRRYRIDANLRPETISPEKDEWVYLINYYGQLGQPELLEWTHRFPHVIVDNAHAYFDDPLPGIDTIYTCRKFFGVPDGALLYTDAPEKPLPASESRERMTFVLGRFERPAGEFFAEAAENNETLPLQPRAMSALTENLLHAIDYGRVRSARTANFRQLHNALSGINQLSVHPVEGAYAYPLMLPEGARLRRMLIERRIFVPTLWPNVLRDQAEESTARMLAAQILPLPCDQRYGPEDMASIIEAVENCRKEIQEIQA